MTAPATVRDLHPGQTAVLAEPTVADAVRIRLAELGLRAGQEILLIQRAVGGARVVAVAGSRIALDARTAAGLPLAPGPDAAGEPELS